VTTWLRPSARTMIFVNSGGVEQIVTGDMSTT
jgi:hypothetical protein